MKHKRIEIGIGDEANRTTVENMIRLARRDSKSKTILKIAKEIQSKSKDELQLINNIFDYVKATIDYQTDKEGAERLLSLSGSNAERTELLIAPVYLLTEVKKGDCDDMSMAIATLCLALDVPVNYKIIAWRINAFTHVYNEVGFIKTFNMPYWVPCDVVMGVFGKEQKGIKRYEVFRV